MTPHHAQELYFRAKEVVDSLLSEESLAVLAAELRRQQI